VAELVTSRAQAEQLDASDELARLRDQFVLPERCVYLDGNSLGALPRAAPARIAEVVEREWGTGLIRSWNAHGWIDLPARVAAAIAPLVGAAADEISVADSTSVDLFKLLAAALRLRPGRSVILSEAESFPTDLYVAQGLASLLGGVSLRVVPRAELVQALDESVAVLMLSHVDFRTGALHDVGAWTRAAHARGALTLFDLSHSAGAVPLGLAAWDVDLAVGCGYKFLNGGPGAPAFAFVARRHHDRLESPLSGWMGHAEPFAFEAAYRPARGVARLACGTPPVLGLAALECGVRAIASAGIDRLRRKSSALGELLLGLVEHECAGHGIVLASPRAPEARGSQLSFRHPDAYAIVQALIARGVVGDFRTPDVMRFGLAPAYLRFTDVWDAVAALRGVLELREWDRPQHRLRAKVT
jgi:kynureninase